MTSTKSKIGYKIFKSHDLTKEQASARNDCLSGTCTNGRGNYVANEGGVDDGIELRCLHTQKRGPEM